jgi:hypothetical protein
MKKIPLVHIFISFLLSDAAPKHGIFPKSDRLELLRKATHYRAISHNRKRRESFLSDSSATLDDAKSTAKPNEERNGMVNKILSEESADPTLFYLLNVLRAKPDDTSLETFVNRYFPTKKWRDLLQFDASNLTPEQAVGKRVAEELGKDLFEAFIDCIDLSNTDFAIKLLEQAQENDSDSE